MESERSEELFQRFVGRLNAEGVAAFDAFCRSHPEEATDLRALYRRWCADSRPSGEQPPGEGSEATPLGGHSRTEFTDDFTLDFIERLRKRRASQERYRRKEELARGAQGRVYRVWDDDFRRHLAMKVGVARGEPGPSTDERDVRARSRSLARLIEEAQVTGQLDHPGVVPIHDLGLDADGRFYFTMRLVRGKTLDDVFAQVATGEDGWNLPRALSAVLKICETMSFAHSRDVIHRDLKPSNIMVGRFGEVYVMDWGLARVLTNEAGKPVSGTSQDPAPRTWIWTDRKEAQRGSDESPRTDVVGTPAYMSPEQAEGDVEHVGPASDIYSVGAILYRLLSGKMPYEQRSSASPVVMWRRVLAGPPEPLTRLAPQTPPELIAIAERAMARDLSTRYASMEQMADDLRAFLEHRVVSAYRTGPLVELRKWVERNRSVAAIAAALIVVSIAGSWLYAWNEARRTREIERYADRARAVELIAQAAELGPIHPDSLPRYEDWIAATSQLLTKSATYEKKLAELREEARVPDEGTLREDVLTHPSYVDYTVVDRYVEEATATIARLRTKSGPEAADDLEDAAIMERYLPTHRAHHAALKRTVEVRRTFEFDTPSDGRLHEQLSAVTEVLETLRERELPRARRELDAARTLEQGSTIGYVDRWENAQREVAQHEAYGGLRLAPQTGLVPLGPDPDSGLWEFWHVLSGTEPVRGAEGQLQVEPGMGVVLVLVPPIQILVGAQRDPELPNYDPNALENEQPVDADLDPFFLSKYELTQAQWLRLTDRVPSYFFIGSHWKGFGSVSGLHPVENVSWVEVDRVLARFGLALPTEAQWELAARAGAQTPYHFGASFSGEYAINLFDASAASVGNQPGSHMLDDGYPFHAPVHLERPNGFGLHGVHGNVRELCKDRWADLLDNYAREPGTGESQSPAFRRRAVRGASFADPAIAARLARRTNTEPDLGAESIGVRPARPLDRSR